MRKGGKMIPAALINFSLIALEEVGAVIHQFAVSAHSLP